jgi:thymidylate synthase ThyX
MWLYQQLLDNGIAKECARFVLPLGVQTRIYMTGSCRSWMHYIELRSANGTQKEHQDSLLNVRMSSQKCFPDVAEALEWNETRNSSRYGDALSRQVERTTSSHWLANLTVKECKIVFSEYARLHPPTTH